ncbi:MAG: anti-sigma factor [Planctomycetota bacterium]
MKREREELIDYLLGELPLERGRAVAERIARDPDAAADRDLYEESLGLIRAAAAEGWETRRGRARLVWLRPALAAAAVIALVVGGTFLLNGGHHAHTVYEPDVAVGYARAEETDAEGSVFSPARGDGITVRTGKVSVAAIGSEREYALGQGEIVPLGSDVMTSAEGGARLDLPDGGIVFLNTFSTVRVRAHQQGGIALRLLDGVACTVAGPRPLHLAVHETDLILRLRRGAALLRRRPADAVALRGDLFLLLENGERFQVPEAERLPAACAKEPATETVTDEDLDLDWYRDLVFRPGWQVEELELDEAGRATPTCTGADAMLYLRIVPPAAATLRISFGGEPREFALRPDSELRLRLRLRDLGAGPELAVTPTAGLKEARILAAAPRAR